ncbi:hypothetical protein [Anabaena subtropica]|uniref:Uncharacterized protein n=1 Tax=Anabaena subtropica FACHB-260 TaxID=2692884 RepID=A0ABR8CL31_9NOST|nr:hypothetical protein [Anabaena subtropica]MBD2343881.1 hypothetical protein [Anabaena subtropica FACHB-260]
MKTFFIVVLAGISTMGYAPLEAMGEVPLEAIAPLQSSDVNQENWQESILERHEAAALTTEPATINSEWNNVAGTPQNLKDSSISLEQKKGCESFSPLDLLSNPDAIFKECVNPADNRTPQSVEPVEYFKVPGLDSGVKINVTKF